MKKINQSHEELFFHDHYECSCGFKTESGLEFEIHSKRNKMKRTTLTPEHLKPILKNIS